MAETLFSSVSILRSLENGERGEHGLFEVDVDAPAGKTITVTVPTVPATVYDVQEEDPGSGEYEYFDRNMADIAALNAKYPQGDYLLKIYSDAGKTTLEETLVVTFGNGAGGDILFPEEYPALTQPAPADWAVSANTQQTYAWNAYGGAAGTATHMDFSLDSTGETEEEFYAEYDALINGTCSFTPHLEGQAVPAGSYDIELSFFCRRVVQEAGPRIECANERYSRYYVTVANTNTVTFELGGIGWRTGGGELQQEIEQGNAAEAPLVTVPNGWIFKDWDSDFQNITAPTTIRAVYSYSHLLDAGWNLVSAKLNLIDESQNLLLSKGAMTLDANSKAYVCNGNLAANQTFWIYSQNGEEIILSGTAAADGDFEANLQPGWNFVGPRNERILADTGVTAWAWKDNKFSQTKILLAGQGYYLYWTGEQGQLSRILYLVLDLSAGAEAERYPVSFLSDSPAGGWTDEYKTTKLVLRRIPAGTFNMGSPVNELGHQGSETQHLVLLTREFYVGVFEVTQKQWERVMGNWPSYFTNASYRDARPVEKVSYDDIRGSGAGSGWPTNNAVDDGSFLWRLRTKTGQDFDLPTEAQWEYACRAGTTTALNSEKNLTGTGSCPNMAEVGRYWYNGGSGYSSGGDTSGGSAKVGSYLPNQLGLYDMHSNVWEWCQDWYGTYSQEKQTDPGGTAGGSIRVFRGGSWNNSADNCRSAYRYGDSPSYRLNDLGFRLAMTIQ